MVALFIFFRSSLVRPFFAIGSFFEGKIGRDVSYEAVRNLEAENLRLKSEIFIQSAGESEDFSGRKVEFSSGVGGGWGDSGSGSDYSYLEAGIYSYFPFNNRGVVAINKGSVNGIRVGMPVLTPDKFVFGKIKSVKRTQSEVVTIFDPSWKSPVFLDSSSKKAILVGGISPFVDLIAKNLGVFADLPVLNGSDELPYGAPIGFLGDPMDDSGSGLFNADLRLLYNFENTPRVLIITNFP